MQTNQKLKTSLSKVRARGRAREMILANYRMKMSYTRETEAT
jgi:hypothetical protein